MADLLRGDPSARSPVEVVPRSGDVAVIGMAGRFPGAVNVDELWANLAVDGRASAFYPGGTCR